MKVQGWYPDRRRTGRSFCW